MNQQSKCGPPAERGIVCYLWLPDGVCKPLSLHWQKSGGRAVEFEPTRCVFPALGLCAATPFPAIGGHLGTASGRPVDNSSHFDFCNQDHSCFYGENIRIVTRR